MHTHSLRTIFVDSRYASSGTSSNFLFPLRDTLHLDEGVRIHVDNVRFTDSFPTITTANQNLYFSNGSTGVLHFQIAPGAYSALDLATSIQAATGYTCAYNPQLNSLTIFNPHPILSDTQAIAAGFNPPNSINATLGLDSAQLSSGQTVFPFVTVQPYQEVFLRSRTLKVRGVHGNLKENDILCAIQLTGGFTSIVNFSMPVTTWHDSHHINASTLDFQLTDRHCIPLDLKSSLAFQITFDD